MTKRNTQKILSLQPIHLQILEAMDRYHLIGPDQLLTLFVRGGTHSARKRRLYRLLEVLKDHNLFEARAFAYRDGNGVDRLTKLYSLTKAGVELVVETYGEARGIRKISILHQPHFMLKLQSMTAIEGAAYASGRSLIRHVDDADFKAMKRQDWPFGVVPDAYLEFEDLSFFFEADMGTEAASGVARNAFSKKVPEYVNIMHSLDSTPLLADAPNPLVLTLAYKRVRAKHLLEATEKAKGRRWFWFASLDTFDLDDAFNQPFAVATADELFTIQDKIRLTR